MTTFLLGGVLEVARLGFGAMRLVGVDRERSRAVLRRAVELGMTLIDTADAYGSGENEEQIADALHPYPPGLVLATKGGLVNDGSSWWRRDGRPEHLRAACEASLRRLQIERIDLYQLHRVDEAVPLAESVGALRELKEEGKIRHVGLSNVSVAQVEEARAIVEIASVQNRYNRDDRASDDVVDHCERHGIAFLPWAPLAGRPPREAIPWLLARSPVVCPIPGTSRVDHLEEIVAPSLARSPRR